jgi:peptide/nickel transport system substrate-binding protein
VNGVRAKNGRPLAFSILVPTSSRPRMRYAVLIQDQLKAVGAQVNIESMDYANFFTRLQAGTFDAAMNSYTADPAPSGIKQGWGTEGMPPAGANYGHYSSPAFDALVDSASKTFDRPRAQGYFHRAYQTIVDDAPAVWLYEILNVAGKHRRIHPEGLRVDAWWANLPDWWIPAGERIERDRIGLRAAPQTTTRP